MSLGGSSDEPLNSARSYGTPLEIISSQKSVGSWGTPRDDRFISPRVGLNSQRSASGSDGEWITPRADSKSGYDGDVLDMRGGGGGRRRKDSILSRRISTAINMLMATITKTNLLTSVLVLVVVVVMMLMKMD